MALLKRKVLVIGSGISAYGAILALIKKEKTEIDVIDIGLKGSYKNQPNREIANSKDISGSYFAYGVNDQRWGRKLYSQRICSSHAFGGFSKVYSGSILQPQISDLTKWPSQSIPSNEDYKEIISNLKINHHKDELDKHFPLYPNNKKIKFKEIKLLGNSRIAFNKDGKDNKYEENLPFDASKEIEKWIKNKKINYFNNCFVESIKKKDKKLIVSYIKNNKKSYCEYDFVYVGAGCVNTTAIIDRSLFDKGNRNYFIKEAPILLNLCIKFKKDPNFKNKNNKYVLCSSFLEVLSKLTSRKWSHTQIGEINKIILKKIEKKFPLSIYKIIEFFVKYTNFSQSFFHSDLKKASIMLTSSIEIDSKKNVFQKITIKEEPYLINWRLSFLIKFSIISKFNKLRLVPLPLSQLISAYLRGNKLGGWHIGCTLPMINNPTKLNECNTKGEIFGMKNLFIIDSSSFPSIPGSSIALLTMASSYKIAKDSYL